MIHQASRWYMPSYWWAPWYLFTVSLAIPFLLHFNCLLMPAIKSSTAHDGMVDRDLWHCLLTASAVSQPLPAPSAVDTTWPRSLLQIQYYNPELVTVQYHAWTRSSEIPAWSNNFSIVLLAYAAHYSFSIMKYISLQLTIMTLTFPCKTSILP